MWFDHRLERDGVDTVVAVTGHEVRSQRHFVTFRLEDSHGRPWLTPTVELDESSYADAVRTDQLTVRALPGTLRWWRAEGQTGRGVLVPATLALNLALLVMGAVLLWSRESFDERLPVDGRTHW